MRRAVLASVILAGCSHSFPNDPACVLVPAGGWGPSEGTTCLAAGADQLYASLLVDAGKPHSVVIPCDGDEKTFNTEEALAAYQRLLGSARSRLQLRYGEPSESAFFDAGKRVVDLSDALIAVWNGEAARGLGGTGDIVQYALSRGASIIHVNPVAHETRWLTSGQ